MKWFKRISAFVLLAIIILVLFNFKLTVYGLSQLKGQMNIIWNAKPVEDILKNVATPNSIKKKLLLIDEIKQFATDSLSLKSTKNYTTFYDQHGKAVLMVLTASEKFQLKAYEWKFPVLGNVSYKGFFNFKKGELEKKEMDDKGYDTDYGATGAWSTLGWFRDPIFSGMLKRNEGQLAELIIHEMTHGTLYLKSSVDFNENLASVIGEEGAIRFLSLKYGNESVEMKNYLDTKEDYDHFSAQMLRGAAQLDSLYHSFKEKLSIKQKEILKNKLIADIVASLDTISFHHPEKYHAYFSENNLPNNAYFMGLKRYDEKKEEMKRELNKKFSGDFGKYLEYVKEKYR